MNKYSNIAKAKAIEQENKKRLLKINPQLNDESGIYILTRKDENGFRFAYIGQAMHILSRLASHMAGYKQHIDLSLKKHKLYSEGNPYGWKVEHMNVPLDQLDEQEKYYIRFYAENGYQLRNISLGGQGESRSSGTIGDRKQPRTYSEGIQQGKKALAKELSSIAEKHLTIAVKPEKQGNKVSERQRDRFMELISVENYEEPGKEMANERK